MALINTGADLLLSGSWQLALVYTGTDTIRGFSTNGGATYLAAGTYGGSSSPATHKITSILGNGVLNVSAVPASVILTSSGGSSVYGSSVTFTSTVTGSTPTGTVTFYDGASAIGSAALSGGQATLMVSDLLATTSPHSITAVYSGDAHNVQATSSALIQTVNPLTVSPATLSVSNKLYDATTAASLILTNSTLTGVLPGDTNNVRIGAGTAAFADKNIGTNKSVTVSGLTLAGSLSGNYSLVPNSGASTANISNIGIAVINVTVTPRPYNTTTTAILNTAGAGLSNVLGSDTVNLNEWECERHVCQRGAGRQQGRDGAWLHHQRDGCDQLHVVSASECDRHHHPGEHHERAGFVRQSIGHGIECDVYRDHHGGCAGSRHPDWQRGFHNQRSFVGRICSVSQRFGGRQYQQSVERAECDPRRLRW